MEITTALQTPLTIVTPIDQYIVIRYLKTETTQGKEFVRSAVDLFCCPHFVSWYYL